MPLVFAEAGRGVPLVFGQQGWGAAIVSIIRLPWRDVLVLVVPASDTPLRCVRWLGA